MGNCERQHIDRKRKYHCAVADCIWIHTILLRISAIFNCTTWTIFCGAVGIHDSRGARVYYVEESSSMKKIILICVCLALLGAIVYLRSNETRIRIGNTSLSVEIARTPAAIEQGLSDRNEIGSNGMLFILPSKTIPAFWMKGMRFPLDFVWIDGNVVVDITEHVSNPAPNTQQKDLPLYRPKQAVTYVLELPDGAVNRYKLKIGDAVQYGVR